MDRALIKMLLYPVRAIVIWLMAWGLITAGLRPLSYEPFAEFIERAGNHGAPLGLLLLSEGEKKIEITVNVQDGWLICDIADNGIGREKAEELKNNSVAIHQSKGIGITRKRLIDFNGDGTIFPIEFFDLYDGNKNPTGTRVIIHIKRKLHSTSV
jgi:hypothetical protein